MEVFPPYISSILKMGEQEGFRSEEYNNSKCAVLLFLFFVSGLVKEINLHKFVAGELAAIICLQKLLPPLNATKKNRAFAVIEFKGVGFKTNTTFFNMVAY